MRCPARPSARVSRSASAAAHHRARALVAGSSESARAAHGSTPGGRSAAAYAARSAPVDRRPRGGRRGRRRVDRGPGCRCRSTGTRRPVRAAGRRRRPAGTRLGRGYVGGGVRVGADRARGRARVRRAASRRRRGRLAPASPVRLVRPGSCVTGSSGHGGQVVAPVPGRRRACRVVVQCRIVVRRRVPVRVERLVRRPPPADRHPWPPPSCGSGHVVGRIVGEVRPAVCRSWVLLPSSAGTGVSTRARTSTSSTCRDLGPDRVPVGLRRGPPPGPAGGVLGRRRVDLGDVRVELPQPALDRVVDGDAVSAYCRSVNR